MLQRLSVKDIRSKTDPELESLIRRCQRDLDECSEKVQSGGYLSEEEREERISIAACLAAAQSEQWGRAPRNAPLTKPGLQGSGQTRTTASGDTAGFDSMGDFMSALFRMSRGQGFDRRLEPLQVRASVGETVPSSGGFAIPTQFVEAALSENLEDTVLLQRCDRQTMTTNKMTAPGFVDTTHATSPYGVSWTWIAEEASWGTLQAMGFRSIALEAKKCGALFLVSNEWLADSSTGIRQRLDAAWRGSLRWFVEDRLWSGAGSGEPLGALNGSAALTIAKQTGQAADTVVTENVLEMWSRLRPGSHNKAIWVASQNVFPQLAMLSLSVGTGGAPVGLLQPSGIAGAPPTSILARPLYLSEHLPALGDAGDLCLLDPTLYLLGDRQQIVMDVSPHVRFESDQTVFRCSARLDGQPVHNALLTLKSGLTTGWLVKIAERA